LVKARPNKLDFNPVVYDDLGVVVFSEGRSDNRYSLADLGGEGDFDEALENFFF
jgi:hypothetical protein